MKKDFLYALTCLCFTIMIGGAVYEHIAVVPKWVAAPPVSLSMFQGEYGLKPELFWLSIHPLNLGLLILTLLVHWKTARKKHVLSVLGLYVCILGVTALFFVPELLSITQTAYAQTVDAGLVKRAATWEQLSLVRLGVLLVMAMILFLGLTKPSVQLHIAGKRTQRKQSSVPVAAGSV